MRNVMFSFFLQGKGRIREKEEGDSLIRNLPRTNQITTWNYIIL
jgi:hypothetical protein